MDWIPWILGLAVVALYVNDSLQQLERARRHARDACERAGVQFLDQSVVRDGIALRRQRGGIALERRYRFEFATDGRTRLGGRLTLCRGRLVALHMDNPDGPGQTIEAIDAAGTASHVPRSQNRPSTERTP